MINIICTHKQKRGHFHAKTTSAKLYIYIGLGSRNLFIDEAHTSRGIFPVFFPCMLPTPLCGIFYKNFSQWIDRKSQEVCSTSENWFSRDRRLKICWVNMTHPTPLILPNLSFNFNYNLIKSLSKYHFQHPPSRDQRDQIWIIETETENV